MTITSPEAAAPADTPEARVKFGPLPHQTIPLCIAERILIGMASGSDKSRKDFGDRLRAAMLADLPALPEANGGRS